MIFVLSIENKKAQFPAMGTDTVRFLQFSCFWFWNTLYMCSCFLLNLKHEIQLLNHIVYCPAATLKSTQDEYNKKALQTLERWVRMVLIPALCSSFDESRIIFLNVLLSGCCYSVWNFKNTSINFSSHMSKTFLWQWNVAIIWLNIQGKSTCSASKNMVQVVGQLSINAYWSQMATKW